MTPINKHVKNASFIKIQSLRRASNKNNINLQTRCQLHFYVLFPGEKEEERRTTHK